MTHRLIINGLEAPLLKVFGCDCGRCSDPKRQANTSMSLIAANGSQEPTQHILFDVGLGVVDSLAASPYFQGTQARLDWILLSHWHPDHTKELNRLCVSHRLNQKWRGLTAPQIPLWCRSGTANWMQIEHSYAWHSFLDPRVSGERLPPGMVLSALDLGMAGVRVTPVTVSHFGADTKPPGRQEVFYSCAIFVVETAVTKAVLLWDIDNQNEWLIHPKTAAEETAVSLLSYADYLFIDTAFWNTRKERTTHPGFGQVRQIAANLQPRQTILMHLSGHPDGRGNPGWGWTNEQWREAAAIAWEEEGLPGRVTVPEIGDEYLI
ncbi:MAG: MBL fold metallo-hydrolase [Aquificales bacterium]|nr:MBL fold metallo-hydrolase [Aquificales bacterium]